MNTIFVKLEQTQKIKGSEHVVSIRTKAVEIANLSKIEGQINFVVEMMNGIKMTLDLAAQSEQKVVIFGGIKFRLNSKFTLYVNVDGIDYSRDEINNFFQGKETYFNNFKNGNVLAKDMCALIRNAIGQSVNLPQSITKSLNA